MSDYVKCPICDHIYCVRSMENWGICTGCGTNNDVLNPRPDQVPTLVSYKEYEEQTILYDVIDMIVPNKGSSIEALNRCLHKVNTSKYGNKYVTIPIKIDVKVPIDKNEEHQIIGINQYVNANQVLNALRNMNQHKLLGRLLIKRATETVDRTLYASDEEDEE